MSVPIDGGDTSAPCPSPNPPTHGLGLGAGLGRDFQEGTFQGPPKGRISRGP